MKELGEYCKACECVMDEATLSQDFSITLGNIATASTNCPQSVENMYTLAVCVHVSPCLEHMTHALHI